MFSWGFLRTFRVGSYLQLFFLVQHPSCGAPNSHSRAMPPRAASATADGAAAPAAVAVLSPQQLQQVVQAMNEQNKRAAGGQFSDAETAELLCMIRLLKPVGADGWKHVEDDFNTLAAQTPGFQECGKLSLKQKFNCLVSMQKPTGEGEMQALNWLALEIQVEIHAEIDAGKASDDDVLGNPSQRCGVPAGTLVIRSRA